MCIRDSTTVSVRSRQWDNRCLLFEDEQGEAITVTRYRYADMTDMFVTSKHGVLSFRCTDLVPARRLCENFNES